MFKQNQIGAGKIKSNQLCKSKQRASLTVSQIITGILGIQGTGKLINVLTGNQNSDLRIIHEGADTITMADRKCGPGSHMDNLNNSTWLRLGSNTVLIAEISRTD